MLAALLLLAAASTPGMAAWVYTQSEPLFFDFAGSGVFWDPCLGGWDELPSGISANCGANAPHTGARFTRGLTELPSGALSDSWRWGFSSSFFGIYTSASHPSVGRSLAACKQGAEGNSFTTSGLDWGKGISLNTFTILFGSTDSRGSNQAVGGMLFNFMNLPGNPQGAPAESASVGAVVCWISNDPSDLNDDHVGLYDINTNEPIITAPVAALTTGPTVNARHQYLLEAKRSPLPWPEAQWNNIVLISMYVGDNLIQDPAPSVPVAGLKNKTVVLPATTDADFANTIMLGTSEFSDTDKPRGDRYGWLRLYELDGGDTDLPFHPTNIAKSAISPGVRVTWTASAGDPTSDVIGYRVKRNGTYIGYVDWEETSYDDPAGSMTDTYEVFAVDKYGNESVFVPDTTPPSVPSNVTATALGHSEISVSWTASTDNTAVASYKVFRNGVDVGQVNHPTTTFNDTGLLALTTYSYTVLAIDASNNESAQSSPPATATTKRANWTWTSVNPLVFEFNDNANNVFMDPTNTETAPLSNYPYATRAVGYSDVMFSVGTSTTPVGTEAAWKHTFSNAGTGSLNIQNSGPDLTGRSPLINRMWTEWNGEVNQFRTDPPGEKLDWGNGIVFEIKAKAVGGDDPSTWPSGYNWGGSSSLGGLQWNLARFGVLQNPFEYRYNGHRMVLCWKTNDPTDPNDDTIGLYDTSSGQHIPEVKFPLGGTPTSAPENVYMVHVKKSPLWTSQQDGIVLANVWVNGVRVMRNEVIGGGWTTGSSPSDGYRDDFQIGDFENNTTQKARGDIYDYVKVYEADALVDVDPPSTPSGVAAVPTGYTSIKLTWNASTDATTECIGYRVVRSGGGWADLLEYVDNGPDNTVYHGTGLLPGTTYTYTVMAVDAAGNLSDWSTPVNVATPTVYTGTEVNFLFNDQGSNSYTYYSNPNDDFYTASVEDPFFYFGVREGAGGGISWGAPGGVNNYKYTFTQSGSEGSMTLQTETPDDQNGSQNGTAQITSSSFADWFKWTKDGDDIRGVSVEVDMDIVGDVNGWCAPFGSFPVVSPCTGSSLDLGHQASDWGTQYGSMATLYFAVAKGYDLTESGRPAGSGDTGDGAAYWFAITPGDIRNSDDDRLRIYSNANFDHSTFRFKDGLGFGLVPEDGTTGSPRDGVIQGTGNRVGLKVAVANAGGNSEIWDVWVTRPGGSTIHVNPTTCQWVSGDVSVGAGFGHGGHTLLSTYENKDNTPNCLRLGNNTAHQIWGTKYKSIKLRNDWDGNVTVEVQSLGDLHQLVGARVIISPDGGEKIVTINPTTADYATFFTYIEQEDRSAGVKVFDSMTPPMAYKGDRVTSITGVVLKDLDGNLYIDVTDGSASFEPATKTIEPVGMNNLTVAGSEATGGVGVANTGILATVWGRVSNVTSDSYMMRFELDDGSGTKVLVQDLFYDGVVNPVANEYWTVTGPIALVSDGSGGYLRSVIADSGRKIQ